jgi:hypothetical protein
MARRTRVRELLLARARARTAEAGAAAEAAKALKRLSAALDRLRAAAERCAAIAGDFPAPCSNNPTAPAARMTIASGFCGRLFSSTISSRRPGEQGDEPSLASDERLG